MKYIMPQANDRAELVEVTEPSYGESISPSTRAETKRQSGTDQGLLDAVDALAALDEVIYSFDVNRAPAISDAEVNDLAAELVAVRKVKDVMEGREAKLKEFAKDTINWRLNIAGNDPETTPGALTSVPNGVKLSKEVSGGKLTVDVNELKKILSDDQFYSVVNIVTTNIQTIVPGGMSRNEEFTKFEINDECLEKQINLGNIGMEDILKATVPNKLRTAMYVRNL